MRKRRQIRFVLSSRAEVSSQKATVYLASRDESKTIATSSRLGADELGPGNDIPMVHKLDLGNPHGHGAKKIAEELLVRESGMDILGAVNI